MLDIHDCNGQLAIEAAGLMKGFRAIVLEGRQAMRALGQDGRVLFRKSDDGTGAARATGALLGHTVPRLAPPVQERARIRSEKGIRWADAS